MSPPHLHVCSLTPSIWWSCSNNTHYTVGFRILDYIKLYPRDILNICLNSSITTPSPSFSHLKFNISPRNIPWHIPIYIPYPICHDISPAYPHGFPMMPWFPRSKRHGGHSGAVCPGDQRLRLGHVALVPALGTVEVPGGPRGNRRFMGDFP